MERKTKILGENPSRANHRLRKLIMFDLAKKLQLDMCFRCGELIQTVEEFSIEHKEAWQSADNPREKFYSLDNIAFSHLSCNIRAGKRHKVYESYKARRQAQWSRYYARNKEKVLANKRKK